MLQETDSEEQTLNKSLEVNYPIPWTLEKVEDWDAQKELWEQTKLSPTPD